LGGELPEAVRPVNQKLQVTPSQERPRFSSTCLPHLLQLARLLRKEIDAKLCTASLPTEWPFLDRVVAWLSPSLGQQAHDFHRSSGSALHELYLPHQIENFDWLLVEELCSQLLGDPQSAHVVRSLLEQGVLRTRG
jgi:hypothetical protein